MTAPFANPLLIALSGIGGLLLLLAALFFQHESYAPFAYAGGIGQCADEPASDRAEESPYKAQFVSCAGFLE